MYRNLQNFVFSYSRASKLSISSKFFLFCALFSVILSFSRSLAQGDVDTPFCYMETEDGTVINLEGVCTPPQEDPVVTERPVTRMSPEQYNRRLEQATELIRRKINSMCPDGTCRPGVDIFAEIDAICDSVACPMMGMQIGYVEE